jgi:hypothetical protein
VRRRDCQISALSIPPSVLPSTTNRATTLPRRIAFLRYCNPRASHTNPSNPLAGIEEPTSSNVRSTSSRNVHSCVRSSCSVLIGQGTPESFRNTLVDSGGDELDQRDRFTWMMVRLSQAWPTSGAAPSYGALLLSQRSNHNASTATLVSTVDSLFCKDPFWKPVRSDGLRSCHLRGDCHSFGGRTAAIALAIAK